MRVKSYKAQLGNFCWSDSEFFLKFAKSFSSDVYLFKIIFVSEVTCDRIKKSTVFCIYSFADENSSILVDWQDCNSRRSGEVSPAIFKILQSPFLKL